MAIVFVMQSCQKEKTDNKFTNMPRNLITFQQQPLEVSKRQRGSASIVLIAGFNSEMATWEKMYKQLDPNMTVFTYNRPGVGQSANVAGKRDAATIANELKAVLQATILSRLTFLWHIPWAAFMPACFIIKTLRW
jgi:pimeloyl-ACP methyl ester carboxylesterase